MIAAPKDSRTSQCFLLVVSTKIFTCKCIWEGRTQLDGKLVMNPPPTTSHPRCVPRVRGRNLYRTCRKTLTPLYEALEAPSPALANVRVISHTESSKNFGVMAVELTKRLRRSTNRNP